jgi:hypothetical protein
MTTLYTRWHRFDEHGVKYIKNHPVGEKPSSEPGFTEWKRGTGPFSEVQLNTLRIAVQKACKGVPKTPEQKQKMSQAKLGVPKTEQHKQAMKTAWARRRNLISHAHYDDNKTNSQTTARGT